MSEITLGPPNLAASVAPKFAVLLRHFWVSEEYDIVTAAPPNTHLLVGDVEGKVGAGIGANSLLRLHADANCQLGPAILCNNHWFPDYTNHV